MVEAIFRGSPVVTTTGGSLPEVAGDAATLIEPGDDDALAAAIAKLATDLAACQDVLPPMAAAEPPPLPGRAARS